MKITNLEKTNIKTTFTLDVDKNDWINEQSTVRKQMAKQLSIPGFRKGHVPLEIANAHIAPVEVMNNALNSVIRKTMVDLGKSPKYIENKQIIDESMKIEIKEVDESKLILLVTYDNKPTIALPDYKNVTNFNYKKPIVTEQEIQHELDNLTKADRSYTPKLDNTIAKGDMVTFDFKGFLGDKPFAGGEAKDFRLEIGSNQFIPGFEDKMVGLKAGDKTKIDVTFPTDYHSKDLAGKNTTFELNIKKIENICKPTIDSGYIAKLNIPGVLNEAQLKEHIKSYITTNKDYSQKQTAISQISDYLVKNTKTDFIPEYILSEYERVWKAQFEQQAKQANKKIEEFIKQKGYSSMEDFNKKNKEQAREMAILYFATEKLMDELDIKVSDEDLKQEVTKVARYYQIEPKELEKNIEFVEKTKIRLRSNKMFDKIIDLNLMK